MIMDSTLGFGMLQFQRQFMTVDGTESNVKQVAQLLRCGNTFSASGHWNFCDPHIADWNE
jgi:hypothetical protein